MSQDFLQTDGLAKSATDPGMYWLPPQSVPTMGNYFQHNGYDAVLKGKWHLTYLNIALNDGSYLPTYDEHGVPILKNEQFYLEKNVLNEFGYENWIGPEPHGSYVLDSGSSVAPGDIGRDVGNLPRRSSLSWKSSKRIQSVHGFRSDEAMSILTISPRTACMPAYRSSQARLGSFFQSTRPCQDIYLSPSFRPAFRKTYNPSHLHR